MLWSCRLKYRKGCCRFGIKNGLSRGRTVSITQIRLQVVPRRRRMERGLPAEHLPPAQTGNPRSSSPPILTLEARMPLVETDTLAISRNSPTCQSRNNSCFGRTHLAQEQHNAPTLHLNLRNGFRAAHMDDGYLILDRIMTLLSTQATKKIYLHCACAESEHEHAISASSPNFKSGTDRMHRLC